jgi:hypothetical protein
MVVQLPVGTGSLGSVQITTTGDMTVGRVEIHGTRDILELGQWNELNRVMVSIADRVKLRYE